MSACCTYPPKPSWLRARAPGSREFLRTRALLDVIGINTVCQEAHCPNIGECWSQKTATFMILGDRCTRSCHFCAVKKNGKRLPRPDPKEPDRVAAAAAALKLKHVVVTSVTRDDLPDNGANIFAQTVENLRKMLPDCSIELLIPDLQGSITDLKTILAATPTVLNHNIETVKRLYGQARPEADYQRSLTLLANVKKLTPGIVTKSGLMVGLGETRSELTATLLDLAAVGVEILTIGQYLRPSGQQLPIVRYLTLDEFESLRQEALDKGFKHVESGPLVRSSYHARDHLQALEKNCYNAE